MNWVTSPGEAERGTVDTTERRRSSQLILVMRGLRSLAYGFLAVILGVVLAGEGFSPAAIGVLITVSLVGDMVGTYVISLVADTWGRRRMLMVLALLMAVTGVIFGLATSYPVLLLAAFFGTLGTSASETAPFLPIDQAMLAQVTIPEHWTALLPATTWSHSPARRWEPWRQGSLISWRGPGCPLPPAFASCSARMPCWRSSSPDSRCAFFHRWKRLSVLLSRSRAWGSVLRRGFIARAASCGG